MEKIIDPIDRKLILNELNSSTYLRKTRKGGNQIYCVNIHNSPNTVQEIGRLREISFRDAGGGTGNPVDLDKFDTIEKCYQQLIVWSPEDQEIIGGYRYILCDNVIENGEIALSTAHYFKFSERFINDFLPNTIELGRSWVQPNFQPSVNPRKGLFALDNIWDGLGAIVKNNPRIKYFVGKVTMYPSYNLEARDFLLHFMHFYFPDNEELLTPHIPLVQDYDSEKFNQLLHGLDFKEGYKVLNNFIREKGEFIPPLVNIYMNLSRSMKTFGTAINNDFGAVEETGILVSLVDIYEEKKERYMIYDE
tara:strand:+ start:353 stop:1270 length:918 start_codon:yes stop_codon:yes gene_type:complete